jgi:hypothetical protein
MKLGRGEHKFVKKQEAAFSKFVVEIRKKAERAKSDFCCL